MIIGENDQVNPEKPAIVTYCQFLALYLQKISDAIQLNHVGQICGKMLKFQPGAMLGGMALPGQHAGHCARIDIASLTEGKSGLPSIDGSNPCCQFCGSSFMRKSGCRGKHNQDFLA